MKNRVYFVLFALLLGFTGCRQEDDLTPSYMLSSFAPDPAATDEESVLRRNFFEETGCYLLFSDTLRHEYKGLDVYGNPYYETEMVNLEWNMTAVGTAKIVFDYIEGVENKRKVTSFLKNNLVPYVKDVLPHSILVVNNMDQYKINNSLYQYVSSPLTYSNVQCLTLNTSFLGEMDDKEYAQEICYEIILSSWGGDPTSYFYNGSKAKDFFAVSKSNYDYRKSWCYPSVPNGLGDEYLIYLYPLGFIINPYETYSPKAKDDAISYIKACLLMTEEEFTTLYADHSVVLKKYYLIKPLVEATGIKF